MGSSAKTNAAKLETLKKSVGKKTKTPLGIKPVDENRLHDHKKDTKGAESRKKPGRKPLPKEKKRRHAVTIYLDDSEMETLKKRAARSFLTPQKFFGMLVRKSGVLAVTP